MYSRSFSEQIPQKMQIPESYSGIALRQSEDESDKIFESEASEKEVNDNPPHTNQEKSESVFAPLSDGLLGKLQLSKIFSGLKDSLGFKTEIGLEEILIIAIGAYLLFSKSGDKECALIVLALLFVK